MIINEVRVRVNDTCDNHTSYLMGYTTDNKQTIESLFNFDYAFLELEIKEINIEDTRTLNKRFKEYLRKGII